MKKSYVLIFLIWFINFDIFSQGTHNQVAEFTTKCYLKNGNVYVKFSSGREKQLTYSGLDFSPLLVTQNNIVVFVRKVLAPQGLIKYKICKVEISTLVETVITDKKPFKDGLNMSNELLSVANPTLSLDKKSIYFITDKWVTSGELVKVDLKTGSWKELFAAETFELLVKEPYKGNFLCGKSEIRDKGRDTYYKLVDENGKVLKEFENQESMIKFKNQIN